MRKPIIILTLLLVCVTFVSAEEDRYAEYDAFWDSTDELVNEFITKMSEVQPYLAYPSGSDEEREDIVWQLEVFVNDLSKIRIKYDKLTIPPGMEEAHNQFQAGMDAYISGISRVGGGIKRKYKKTFNSGIAEINNANTFIDKGYVEMETVYKNL